MGRRKNDFYQTTKILVDNLLKIVSPSGTVIECCNGKGDISNLLKNISNISLITNDLYEEANYRLDMRYSGMWDKLPSIDWVISNPPFSDALIITKRAIEKATIGVAMLLRISFLEPTYDRAKFFRDNIPTKIFFNQRTSFTGNGKTDNVTTCWIVWEKNKKSNDIHFGFKD